MPELLDHQRQGGDLCFRVGRLGLGNRRPRFRRRKRRLERFNVEWAGAGHGRERMRFAAFRQFLIELRFHGHFTEAPPTRDGCQPQTGSCLSLKVIRR